MKKPTQKAKFSNFKAVYLEEMNKFEFIFEGHGKKNIHKNEIIFRCLILRNIINVISMLEIAEKFK